ncbi:MAG TPA: hypothetical protein PKY10_11555 [Lentisphaeria bacterium]|nr:hypothetical protein [Lentisphaeria bacterium]
MTLFQDIAIIDLLRQREAEFVVVRSCEQKIKEVLGDVDFPFPMPVDLPSQQRRTIRKTPPQKKPPSLSAPPGIAEPTSPVDLGILSSVRKLDASRENAYRLVFLRHGVKDSSFQTDYDLITALAGLHCPEFQLLSLETVSFTDLDDWQVIDTLWEESP